MTVGKVSSGVEMSGGGFVELAGIESVAGACGAGTSHRELVIGIIELKGSRTTSLRDVGGGVL